MKNQVDLEMMPISFYSRRDEGLLWQALESMPHVSHLRLIDRGLAFSLDRTQLDWDSFKDLMALYIRYQADLNTLSPLCPNEEVKAWFLDPAREWHAQLRG